MDELNQNWTLSIVSNRFPKVSSSIKWVFLKSTCTERNNKTVYGANDAHFYWKSHRNGHKCRLFALYSNEKDILKCINDATILNLWYKIKRVNQLNVFYRTSRSRFLINNTPQLLIWWVTVQYIVCDLCAIWFQNCTSGYVEMNTLKDD